MQLSITEITLGRSKGVWLHEGPFLFDKGVEVVAGEIIIRVDRESSSEGGFSLVVLTFLYEDNSEIAIYAGIWCDVESGSVSGFSLVMATMCTIKATEVQKNIAASRIDIVSGLVSVLCPFELIFIFCQKTTEIQVCCLCRFDFDRG